MPPIFGAIIIIFIAGFSLCNIQRKGLISICYLMASRVRLPCFLMILWESRKSGMVKNAFFKYPHQEYYTPKAFTRINGIIITI